MAFVYMLLLCNTAAKSQSRLYEQTIYLSEALAHNWTEGETLRVEEANQSYELFPYCI